MCLYETVINVITDDIAEYVCFKNLDIFIDIFIDRYLTGAFMKLYLALQGKWISRETRHWIL